MGGTGSGFQGRRRLAVEDGLTLSISQMLKKRALVPGQATAGIWSWHYASGGEAFAKIGYVADLRSPDHALVKLNYTVSGEPQEQVIRLTSTTPRYGGRRWWFVCPLAPPRRAAKLHLPPGAQRFGSREAHGLTYQSVRDSRKFSALWRMVGKEMDLDPELARRAFKRGGA